MAEDAEARILIKARAELEQAVRETKRALNQIKREAHETTQAAKGVGSAFADIGKIAAGIGAANVMGDIMGAVKSAAGEVIRFSSALQDAEVSFRVMLGSAEKANQFLSDLQKFAGATPFAFEELVGLSQRLRGMGIELENLLPSINLLGTIAAGVGTEKLPQLVLAFGQVQAAGRLTGNELRQFTEAGVDLTNALSTSMGKSIAEIRKLSEEGKIGFADVVRALNTMIEEGGAFTGLLEERSKTFTGAVRNMQDVLQQAGATAFRPIFEAMTDFAVRLANLLQTDAFQEWVRGIAEIMKGFAAEMHKVPLIVIDMARDTVIGFQQLRLGAATAFGGVVADAISAAAAVRSAWASITGTGTLDPNVGGGLRIGGRGQHPGFTPPSDPAADDWKKAADDLRANAAKVREDVERDVEAMNALAEEWKKAWADAATGAGSSLEGLGLQFDFSKIRAAGFNEEAKKGKSILQELEVSASTMREAMDLLAFTSDQQRVVLQALGVAAIDAGPILEGLGVTADRLSLAFERAGLHIEGLGEKLKAAMEAEKARKDAEREAEEAARKMEAEAKRAAEELERSYKGAAEKMRDFMVTALTEGKDVAAGTADYFRDVWLNDMKDRIAAVARQIQDAMRQGLDAGAILRDNQGLFDGFQAAMKAIADAADAPRKAAEALREAIDEAKKASQQWLTELEAKGRADFDQGLIGGGEKRVQEAWQRQTFGATLDEMRKAYQQAAAMQQAEDARLEARNRKRLLKAQSQQRNASENRLAAYVARVTGQGVSFNEGAPGLFGELRQALANMTAAAQSIQNNGVNVNQRSLATHEAGGPKTSRLLQMSGAAYARG